MLTGKKIALFETGSIGLIVTAGAAALNLAETKKEKSFCNLDVLKIVKPVDNTTLVKAYKNVKQKYYPEKDLLINNKINKEK